MHMKTLFLKFSILVSLMLPGISLSEAQNPERHPVYEPSTTQGSPAATERNIFLNTQVTASGTYEGDKPEFAIDGKVNPNQYWGQENLPVWHQIDMGGEKILSRIHLWPYWKDGRIYTFLIEGSRDGQTWQTLVDQSANSITGTSDGFRYSFPPVNIRYVKTTFLTNSAGNASGGHIVEIQGFSKEQDTNLQAAAAPIDQPFDINTIPDKSRLPQSITATAWAGERVNGRIVLWGEANLSQVHISQPSVFFPNSKSTVPASASFLRYTKAKDKLYADIIDNTPSIDIPANTVRCAWVSIDIPENFPAGVHTGYIHVSAAESNSLKIPIEITVLPAVLPKPSQWNIHLDLWQHPEAVARWHDVPSWSPEHIALLRPVMKRLADAGQKTITCSLIDEAWGGQTYDWWPSMIEWIKGTDGKMRYDYTNFDKYVSLMISLGIKDQINCYTMIPWSLKLRYWDELKSSYQYLELKPGEKSYEDIWAHFLADFRKHVKSKGWLNMTCIAIDERPDRMVKAAVEIISKYAPEFKVVSAVNNVSAMSDLVYDISPIIQHTHFITPELLAKRKAAKKKTTFYVCTSPPVPNTFTHSPLAESEWIPLFAAANDLDGFLRWAYNSWNRNPFEKTDFGNWPAGDCWLVYPGNRSSVRFERLRDGIENFEKINILRQKAASPKASPQFKTAVREMNATLKTLFTISRSKGTEHAEDIKKVNDLINKATVLSSNR